MIARPGKTPSHHARLTKLRASERMSPQVGVSALTPRPRNDSTASVRIAFETLTVASTITGAVMLGRMWRPMIRQSEQPTARAAATYCSSLTERVMPRATRAKSSR